MSATTAPLRSHAEIARLGMEHMAKQVMPNLSPEVDGQYVAIDVDTGEFELDEDDLTAVRRLKGRCPSADVWLGRAGYPETCHIGSFR